jgi:glycosyltransferase involved in cell wall biosynthesis
VSPPLRIVWLVYDSLEQATGGYVYDRLIVEGLRAGGDEVTVVDPRESPGDLPEGDVLVGDGLCVRELGPLFEETPGRSRVLLVHHMPSWEIEQSDRGTLAELEARAVRASDLLLATGTVTADRLSRERPGRPVRVVAPGSDRLAALPRVPAEPGEPLRLLFIGSLTARKRCGWLLDAMQALPDDRAVLTLIGDDSREPEHAQALLRRIADSAALARRVRVSGLVDDPSVALALSRADALVLPSSLEGFGMVLTEALHAGVPVIASPQAAAAAALQQHPSVLVAGDPSALREAIERLASDRRALARATDAAFTWRGPRWSEAVTAFRECLAAAPAPPREPAPSR